MSATAALPRGRGPLFPYSIPEPQLQETQNDTPFCHFVGQKMAIGRVFCDVVVLKGSFELASGKLVQSENQAPIVLADRYRESEEAAATSLEHHGELHLGKPGADLVVTGTAVPPGGRPVSSWLCSVAVFDGARSCAELTLEATGPRHFQHRALSGWSLSNPNPTAGVEISYELAFGGSYRNPRGGDHEPSWVVDETNPSGRGFFDENAIDRGSSYPGPQWQHPMDPIKTIQQRAALAGFGPVARSWESRVRYAGTYDDAWLARTREDAGRGVVPDYAPDFDPRFFHCAHPGLICPAPLRGDERVGLRGFVASAPELVFQLPGLRPHADVLANVGSWKKVPLRLDTVHVDLRAARVELVWRLVLDPREEIGSALLSLEDA